MTEQNPSGSFVSYSVQQPDGSFTHHQVPLSSEVFAEIFDDVPPPAEKGGAPFPPTPQPNQLVKDYGRVVVNDDGRPLTLDLKEYYAGCGVYYLEAEAPGDSFGCAKQMSGGQRIRVRDNILDATFVVREIKVDSEACIVTGYVLESCGPYAVNELNLHGKLVGIFRRNLKQFITEHDWIRERLQELGPAAHKAITEALADAASDWNSLPEGQRPRINWEAEKERNFQAAWLNLPVNQVAPGGFGVRPQA